MMNFFVAPSSELSGGSVSGLNLRRWREENVINWHKIVCNISHSLSPTSSLVPYLTVLYQDLGKIFLIHISSHSQDKRPPLACLIYWPVIVIIKPSPRYSLVWVYLDVNSVLIFDQLNITIWHPLSTKNIQLQSSLQQDQIFSQSINVLQNFNLCFHGFIDISCCWLLKKIRHENVTGRIGEGESDLRHATCKECSKEMELVLDCQCLELDQREKQSGPNGQEQCLGTPVQITTSIRDDSLLYF